MWILNWYREGGNGGQTVTQIIYKDRRLIVKTKEIKRAKIVVQDMENPMIKVIRTSQPKINEISLEKLSINIKKVKLIKVIELCQ